MKLKLKELIEQKGITSKYLAKKINASENTISLILNGKTNPNLSTLLKLAEALDLQIIDLFERKKDNLEGRSKQEIIQDIKFLLDELEKRP